MGMEPLFDLEADEVVYLDGMRGVVRERRPSDRSGSDDYLVKFDNGVEKVCWGSDLEREDDQ